MMSLDERLDKAEEMIQKPSFRENKGLGNEVGYLRAVPTVFMGGGSAILKRHVTAQDAICRPVFMDGR